MSANCGCCGPSEPREAPPVYVRRPQYPSPFVERKYAQSPPQGPPEVKGPDPEVWGETAPGRNASNFEEYDALEERRKRAEEAEQAAQELKEELEGKRKVSLTCTGDPIRIEKGQTLEMDLLSGQATLIPHVGEVRYPQDEEYAEPPWAGVPPSQQEKINAEGPDRSKTPEMLRMTAEAERFYMELHAWKGDWNYSKGQLIEHITRNFNHLIEAIVEGDEREILAEGCGVTNHVKMAIYLLAHEELEKVQDWVPVLERINEEEGGF